MPLAVPRGGFFYAILSYPDGIDDIQPMADIHAYGEIWMQLGVILRIMSDFFHTGEKLFLFYIEKCLVL
jgi:hypothetical protein